MKVVPENENVVLVALGDFTPAIFTPSWFSANELIDPKDAEAATIEVVHKHLSSFNLPWFKFIAQPERITLAPTDPPEIRAFDLFIKVFREKLPHTPIRAVGINYVVNFRVASFEVLNKFGDLLAPKEPWGESGKEMNLSAPKRNPPLPPGSRHGGLRSLTMVQNFRSDGLSGHWEVRIEPSLSVHPGVFIEVNDHYSVPNDTEVIGALPLIEIIQDKFDASIQAAKALVQHMMKNAEDLEYANG